MLHHLLPTKSTAPIILDRLIRSRMEMHHQAQELDTQVKMAASGD
jgi:hypothetical protein